MEPLTVQHVTSEYSTIFDGRIRSMQGKEFYISLLNSVKPLCINTPRDILFACHNKLKVELDLLE